MAGTSRFYMVADLDNYLQMMLTTTIMMMMTITTTTITKVINLCRTKYDTSLESQDQRDLETDNDNDNNDDDDDDYINNNNNNDKNHNSFLKIREEGKSWQAGGPALNNTLVGLNLSSENQVVNYHVLAGYETALQHKNVRVTYLIG